MHELWLPRISIIRGCLLLPERGDQADPVSRRQLERGRRDRADAANSRRLGRERFNPEHYRCGSSPSTQTTFADIVIAASGGHFARLVRRATPGRGGGCRYTALWNAFTSPTTALPWRRRALHRHRDKILPPRLASNTSCATPHGKSSSV